MVASPATGGGADDGAPAGSETDAVVRLGFRLDGKRRVSASGGASISGGGDGASATRGPPAGTAIGGAALGNLLSASALSSRAASAAAKNGAAAPSSASSFPLASGFSSSLPFAPRAGFRPPSRAGPGGSRGLAGRLLVRAFFDDMKAVSTHRINQKNAFQVDLIDKLALVVHQQLVKTDSAAALPDAPEGQQALLDGPPFDLQRKEGAGAGGRATGGEDEEEGITFTHVSSAVEGATRVYGYRVEAVYDQTYHVLNLMSASRPGGEEEAEGERAAHPTRRGRHHQQLLLFKKGGSSTLAPEAELTDSQIEKDSCVDPYFLKISGMFDQAGAKGLLLANLEVDTSLRMKLDGERRAFPTGALADEAVPEKNQASPAAGDEKVADEESVAGEAPEEPAVDCAFLKDLLLAGESPASVLSLDICAKPISHFRSLLESLRRGRDVRAGGGLSDADDEAQDFELEAESLEAELDDFYGAPLGGDSRLGDASQPPELDDLSARVGEEYMCDAKASAFYDEPQDAKAPNGLEGSMDDQLYADAMDFCDDVHGASSADAWSRREDTADADMGVEGQAHADRSFASFEEEHESSDSTAPAKSYSFDRLVPAFSQSLGVPSGGSGAQLAARRAAVGLLSTAAEGRPDGARPGGAAASLQGRADDRLSSVSSLSSSSSAVGLLGDSGGLGRKGGLAAAGSQAAAGRLTAKERQLRKQEQLREMINPFRVDMSDLDTKSGGLPLGSKFQCYVPRPQENITVASDFTSSPFFHSPHLLVSLAMVPFKEIRLFRHTGPAGASSAPDRAGGAPGAHQEDERLREDEGAWEATLVDAGDDGALGADGFWPSVGHAPLSKQRACEEADANAQHLLEGGGLFDSWSDTAMSAADGDQASSYIARLFERGDAASRGGAGLSLGDIMLLEEPQKVGAGELRLTLPSRYVDVAVVKKALKTTLGVLPGADDADDEGGERNQRKRKRGSQEQAIAGADGESSAEEDERSGKEVECRELALLSADRHDGVDFATLCTETAKKLPVTVRANCSSQMLFVCLLYTCNEETLHLERSADFTSFSAFVNAPKDWHTRDDLEAARALETVASYPPLALPALPEKKRKDCDAEEKTGQADGATRDAAEDDSSPKKAKKRLMLAGEEVDAEWRKRKKDETERRKKRKEQRRRKRVLEKPDDSEDDADSEDGFESC
ncbi:hypothetical protein BESB_021030 [Besnoitia besnoiti]|uniref:Condensin complex subunit 2 n=1 Tax=Besnoitia besnoiti TaxID=94643 RepID=A0A2A9M9V9_BESBE|nr:hypothetical protein BESB_021030 [Besnoitia besnoiti]PFH32162.1 hypothetical protein BESB_021030 [Besnoitia besnoiti]